ncbi:MAG: hypothetical protein R8K48_07640 [Gallionella sp.]
MSSQFLMGLFAVTVGVILNFLGDQVLGVRMELFSGLSTFSFAWGLDVFLLPFLVGIVVSRIYGLGGKWLCYFPPIIVRSVSYAYIVYATSGPPHGTILNPLGWWSLYVILAVESAAMGGIVGEVIFKKVYGRTNFKNTSEINQPILEKDS